MRKDDNKSSWGNDIFIILCRYNPFRTLSLRPPTTCRVDHIKEVGGGKLGKLRAALCLYASFWLSRARLCSERRKKNCGYISWSGAFFPALQTLKLVPLRFFQAVGFCVKKVDAPLSRKKKTSALDGIPTEILWSCRAHFTNRAALARVEFRTEF